ncbi:MAG TPA: hypothetical protein GX526_04675 [Thermoanaerobacterales bacterium]|nr:hypothetical protein [Thermoanaerobacterales bacterium]
MINSIIKPMLLSGSDVVSTENDIIHEVKLDGFRCILKMINSKLYLQSRHGNFTKGFPEIESAYGYINANEVILDGEMICIKDGHPDFELVMSRYMANRKDTVHRLSLSCPAIYYAFDILYKDGKVLTSLPLIERKKILEATVSPNNNIKIVDYYVGKGQEISNMSKKMDLEGIVEKKINSRYTLNARSKDWIKIKNYRFTQCVITGLRKGKFALYLADEKLNPLGICEFAPPAERKALYKVIPYAKNDEDKDQIYFKPLIRCKVKHIGFTSRGYLHTPALTSLVV